MNNKHLIDIAYEIASKKLKSKQFSFRELFKLIVEKHPEHKNDVGDLYIELINDTRFLSTGKDKWTLTEYLKYEDIQKISSSMFGLDKYTLDDDLDDDLKELLADAESMRDKEKDDIESYNNIDEDDIKNDSDNIAYDSSVEDEELDINNELVDDSDTEEDDSDLDDDLDTDDLDADLDDEDLLVDDEDLDIDDDEDDEDMDDDLE